MSAGNIAFRYNKIDVTEKLNKSFITIGKVGIDIENDILVSRPSIELLSCTKNIYISMSVLFHVKSNDCML